MVHQTLTLGLAVQLSIYLWQIFHLATLLRYFTAITFLDYLRSNKILAVGTTLTNRNFVKSPKYTKEETTLRRTRFLRRMG